jgi:hypothetical protein
LPEKKQRPCHFSFPFTFNVLKGNQAARSGNGIPLDAMVRQSGKGGLPLVAALPQRWPYAAAP